MDIELRKIRHSPSLSEETEAFTADLYINGTHAAIASNRGTGGPTDYQAISEEGKKLVREAEAYCAGLPPTQSSEFEGLEYPMDLEQFINDLLEAHLRQKDLHQFNRKLERATQKALVYGIPDESFTPFSFKMTIQEIIAKPTNRQAIINTINRRILPHLKDGNILLNTNIPEDILLAAGLRPGQYRKPVPMLSVSKKVSNGKGKRP